MSPHFVAVGIGSTLGTILGSSLSSLEKEIKEIKEIREMKEAIAKTWLKNEGGYTEAQVQDITAGHPRGDLDPDSDLDVKLNLDLQTEKLKDAITVVQGSAKPLLEKKVVGKGQISIVKGSARPWVRGRRTHSLWEAQAKARARSAGEVEVVEGGEGVEGGEVVEGAEGSEDDAIWLGR